MLQVCLQGVVCSLIDGPDFIKLHLNHSKQTYSNIAAVLFDSNDIFWVDLDPLVAAAAAAATTTASAVKLNYLFPNKGEIGILGSCNGLLALTHFRSNDIVLWNPSTTWYRKLPTLSSTYIFHNLGLFGFGHDPINVDYKLMQTTQDSQLNVYSAKANA